MFPKNFKFGFSISGFQSEMGVSDEDPNSDWWKWVHDKANIATGIVSGDLPENGIGYWDLYKRYHALAKELLVNTARLGIEWSRIFPKGTSDVKVSVEENKEDIVNIEVKENDMEKLEKLANKHALDRYTEIFRNLRENEISLIINCYHWPIPLVLHDPVEARETGLSNKRNGWLSHSTVVEFVKYCSFLAWKFSDLAESFSLMNEPNVIYSTGYMSMKSGFPPCYPSVNAAMLAKKHIIEACARSFDCMKAFTAKPVGLIYANSDIQALSPNDEDAVERATYDERYSFFDALTKGEFGWVSCVSDNDSRFSEKKSSTERPDLKRRLDWIGVNYYSRAVVKKTGDTCSSLAGYGHDAVPGWPSKDNREVSDFGWEVYPKGLYNVLRGYNDRYHLPMTVTENGVADSLDKLRPRFLVSHIHQVTKAISEGINVNGYLHWSLLDNYEWAQGFRMKFGLAGVDLKTKRVEMRPSALVFKRIAENHGIPEDMEWMVSE
jgi:beta-galactosidase